MALLQFPLALATAGSPGPCAAGFDTGFHTFRQQYALAVFARQQCLNNRLETTPAGFMPAAMNAGNMPPAQTSHQEN
jgi:hypothetical protein